MSMMRSKGLEEAADLLFRLPRVMRMSLEREIFKPPLKAINGNLAPHHMFIMKIVDEEGRLYISEIGDMASISKAQMTDSVDKLTSFGLLERVPDPADRRKIGIILTEKGKSTLAKFDAAMRKRMIDSLSWLQGEELTKLLDALKYLVATFEKIGCPASEPRSE